MIELKCKILTSVDIYKKIILLSLNAFIVEMTNISDIKISSKLNQINYH